MDDSHSQYVLEEPETALGLRREELDVAEMGDVVARLRHHRGSRNSRLERHIDLHQTMTI
jgi:hypothetical protein